MDLSKIRVHDKMVVHIKRDATLLSDIFVKHQRVAIYHEQTYHEPINNYLRQHYNEIYDRLYSNGIVFIYIPMLIENLDSLVQFNVPDGISALKNAPATTDFYNNLAENITDIPTTGRPMLLISDYWKSREDKESVCFDCYDLDYADDHQFMYALRHYLPPFKVRHYDLSSNESGLKGNIVCEEGSDDEAYADRESIELISNEIQERINRLYALGVPESLLKQLLSLPEPKPSRLVITENFRILLPDYDNMEIVLNPLSKALYFFYLRHTEGLRFKELRDHRDELYDIYATISPRENIDKMNRSIDDMVDSTKNAVNEHCSRIKAAFVSKFQDRLARQYYITGKAGEPKLITLDRSLVEDRSGEVM
ncbi:MAG: hypothetical protein J5711_05875 [Bacteroidales bacterium]|nr:hypothetical protein [Bacteroidales bacterium]